MFEKAAENVETENRPIQAACYTHKLLKMSLSKNSTEGALEKSRKLVRLYQVRQRSMEIVDYSVTRFDHFFNVILSFFGFFKGYLVFGKIFNLLWQFCCVFGQRSMEIAVLKCDQIWQKIATLEIF